MSYLKKIYCLILFLPLLIMSCSNLLEGNGKKYNGEFGKVTCNIYLPQENSSARAAFPSISLSDTSLCYQVSVFKKDGSVLSDAVVNRISGKKAFEISGIPLNVDFKLEVTVLKNSNIIMKGNSDILKLTAEEPVVAESITVSYLQTFTGKGSVKLPFYIDSVSAITRIYYSIDGESEVQNIDNSNLHIEAISSGNHLITFSFCSSEGILLYQITEAINVYDNVETNKWENSGNNPWLQNVDGVLKLKITSDVIKEYELKTIYVDQTNNDSTETGTYYNPYKSLQKAINKIVSLGNTADEYSICLLSDVSASSRDDCASTDSSEENSFISIYSTSARNITISSYNGIKSIDAGGFGRVLQIKDNPDVSVKLQNLIIKNGTLTASSTAKKGGGIYNACKLELNNVQVLDCSLNSPNTTNSGNVYGGGIYNDSEGSLIIYSSVIDNCSSVAQMKNKLACGGGIYNDGSCTINSGIVTGCKVSGNISSIDANLPMGAGIYNSGSLVLGDTQNNNNKPDVIIGIGTHSGKQYKNPNRCENGSGGGVYNKSSITMKSDCVIGAYKPSSCASVPTDENPDNCGNYITGSAGAGLYCYSGSSCTIDGGYISYNCGNRKSNNSLGIGVYLNSSMTCDVKNLEVSYNYSTKQCLGAGLASYNYSFENLKVFGNAAFEDYVHNGIGAYLYEGCTLKGETWFDELNDIYLKDGLITIGDNLSPKDSSGVIKTVVANVTKATVNNDTEFLSAETPLLISDNVSKFKITNDGGWELIQSSSDPKKGIAKQVLYVAGTGSTVLTAGSTKNGTKEHPYDKLKDAVTNISIDGTLIYIDGSITDSYSSQILKAITISKLPGATTAKLNYIGSETYLQTEANLEINNIEIDGSGENASRAIETKVNNCTVTLYNTNIKNFSGLDNGSGVSLLSGSGVILKGTSSITGCEATYNGAGIYTKSSSCKVYLQDSAYLDESSTIYLKDGGKVTITDSLSKSRVAKITLEDYPVTLDTQKTVLSGEGNLVLDNSSKFYSKDEYEILNNGVLQIKQRTVSFNGNAGSGYSVTGMPSSPQKCKYGNSFELPPAPIHSDNRIFLGWATATSGATTKYAPGNLYNINENVTFYAIWKEVVNMTVSTVTELKDLISKYSSDYEIRANLSTKTITMGKSDFIDIGSKTVTITGGQINISDSFTDFGDYYVFTVGSGGTLTINNCTITGMNSGNAKLIAIKCDNGTAYVKNSTIQKFESNGLGAAIYISNSGVVTMEGSTISGNNARYGSAVYLGSGSNFIMKSGTITGNNYDNGPIIYGSGSFNWQGGDIKSNEDGNVFGTDVKINNTSGKTAS